MLYVQCIYKVEKYKYLWQYELFVSYLDKVFLLLILLVLSLLIRGGSRAGGGGVATPLSYSFIHANTQYSNVAIIALS